MNRGALKTQAALFCGDPDQTRYANQYDDAANRAQEQFALDTRALWKDTSWTSASGDADYDLPTDFMFEDYLLFNGLKIEPISRHRIHELSPGADPFLTVGTPTHYIIDPEQAEKQVLLYPIPQDQDANKTIFMRYFPFPTAMTADTDTPLNSSSLMVQFHMGLAAYIAWLLLTGEIMTPEIATKRMELLKMYNHAITQATDTFKNTVSEPMKMRPEARWGLR